MSDLSGQTIRGYELQEQLGAGGFGAVYRAYQPLLKREVAVKIILPHLANDPDFIRRFEVEAELVARLEHPYIVPLFDYWREPDSAYLVLRLLRGGSLRDLLHDDALNLEQIATILDQICAALHIAHRNNVIHRDIKPDNILLDEDGNAYLTDFGIAKSPNLDSESQPDAKGTLLYMPPEQLQGQPVSTQSDIYAMGIMLYEMLAGQHPFHEASVGEMIMKQMTEPLPDIRDVLSDVSGDVDDVIQQATQKDVADRYADVRELARAFRLALEGQSFADIPAVSPLASVVGDDTVVDLPNPYKGLRAFQEADADQFFGRDALIDRLLECLNQQETEARFLAVVGPSGSGKSSVVKAGLLPALRQGRLDNSQNWFITEMFPGTHPFEELEAALLKVAVNPPDSLLGQLREDERGLVRSVKRILPADDSEVVIVIDQFEELFTLVEDDETRHQFLENILTVVEDARSRIRIIVTLRADFYDKPLHYRDFGELLDKRKVTVFPLSEDELQQAIIQPAEQVGAAFQTGLVGAIIKDVSEQPGMLPLLQYALTELFELRSGRTLTLEAYHDIGGVTGALARRAEDLYQQVDDEGQTAIRQMFLRLVTLGEGTEDTRRRVRRNELPDHPQLPAVLDHYGKARLLTFDRDPITRGPTVEVAHEALIRTWERLKEWVADDREGLRIHRRLTQSARDWQQSGEDDSYLATGSRLAQFEGWSETTNLTLNILEQKYLDTSTETRKLRREQEELRKAHELELQTQAANRLRYLVVGMTIFLVVSFGLSFFAFSQQRQAQSEAANAETQAAIADMNADEASTAQADSAMQAETAIAAQSTSDSNANVAEIQATTAYTNLIEAQNVQALFLADLAQQELAAGHPQDALHLAYLSVNMRDDGYVNYESREALFDSLVPFQSQQLVFFDAGVSSAWWNSDETRLLTISSDGTVKIWNAITGDLLFTATHDASVWSVRWNSDESQLLTTSQDGTAKVWDVLIGNVLLTMNHDDTVRSASWNADETQLLTHSDDGTAKVWDALTGDLLFTATHDDTVSSAWWNSDESQLLTTSQDGTAKVWDALTGDLLFTATHDDTVSSARWNSDESQLLTTSQDGTAKVWEADNWDLLLTASHDDAVRSARWNSDESQLLTHSDDGTAKVWDTTTGDLLFTMDHDDTVRSARWNSDETRLLTRSDDGTAKVWDALTGDLLFTMNHDDRVRSAEWNSDETRLLTLSEDGTAKVWDAGTGNLLFTATHNDRVWSASWNADETRLLTTSYGNTAKVWDAGTGNLLFTATHNDRVWSASWNADETQLLTRSDDGTAKVWDFLTGDLLFIASHDDAVRSARWNSDETGLITYSSDGTVRTWIFDTNLLLTASHDDTIRSASWNADETRLLTWSLEEVNVWDSISGEQLLTASHEDSVRSVEWNADETQLLTRSLEEVKVWDALTGDLLFTATHDNSIWSAEWNAAGTHLLISSQDGTLRVWDAGSGDLLFTDVRSAEWNSDETRLLTISEDGTAKIWDAITGDLLHTIIHDEMIISAEWNLDGTRLLTISTPVRINSPIGTAKV